MSGVQPIKIKISTNIKDEPFQLKFSNIYDPAPGERSRKIEISEDPFFTSDVKYNEKFLASKPYGDILSIFFNRKEFAKAILKQNEPPAPGHAVAVISPEQKMENANENIMIMLKLLFPISYPTKNNLNTSYKKYLQDKGPAISFDISDSFELFSSGEITPFDKRNYSYLQLDSGICTVSEVVWMNDVLNNKLYRELIDRIVEYTEWKHQYAKVLKEEENKVTEQLIIGLTMPPAPGAPPGAPPAPPGAPPAPPGAPGALPGAPKKGYGDLLITVADRELLAQQKRTYNPDDLKKDMTDIITKYISISGPPDATGERKSVKYNDVSTSNDPATRPTLLANKTRFDTELGYMVDYFIDTHVKKSQSNLITQFVRFKERFDFKYSKGVRDLFVIHTRYNSLDKQPKILDLERQHRDKTTEIDRLTNGYTNPNIDWVFGKNNVEQYITNLKEAMDNGNINRNVPRRPVPPEANIENILQRGIFNTIPGNTNDIIINDVNYTRIQFGKIRRSSLDAFLTELDERYTRAKAYLKVLDEKIDKLNAENMAIDNELAELRAPTEKIFVFNGETDNPEVDINTIKEDNDDTIMEMQQEIFKSVIVRYNRYQDLRRSTELSGIYTELDIEIDAIIDQLIKLESIATTNPTPDQILDITGRIKEAFDKLIASGKVSIPRAIGDKLAQTIKISNQIKFLTQLQKDFFKDPATGIPVEYEKNLDPKDSFTTMLMEELNKEKYANFKKMIEFINDSFLKYDAYSLNPRLAKLMEKYFKNESNDFYDQVVIPMTALINADEKTRFDEDPNHVYDVSVTALKSSTWGNEYEIYLQMSVIEGELNSKNQSEIKCQYLDDELTQRFEELMDEQKSFSPSKNKEKPFSIKKAKEERAKHAQEQKEELESVLSAHKHKNAKEIKAEGGKRRTRSSRSSKQKYTKKRAQYIY